MSHTVNTKVVIVGKGIAGLVLSILLKRKGIDHVVLDRIEKKRKPALAETLPPSTLVLLETLELKELFERSSLKTFGYHSLWGTHQVTDNNFFFHNPYKYGLKIAKSILLSDLEKEAGTEVISFQHLLDINLGKNAVQVNLRQANEKLTVNGEILIDATGRNRAVLKKLGIEIDSYDQLIAHSCHLPYFKHPKLTHKVVVESFDGGWGIVSSLNEKTNVMTLFAQQGNQIVKQLKHYEQWQNVLSKTNVLKDFLINDLPVNVVGYDADSSKASQLTGDNWLAIGDAAIAFDPLSSHGISNAIYCASEVSKAIESSLENPAGSSFQDYADTLTQIFGEYLKQKSNLYATEAHYKEG